MRAVDVGVQGRACMLGVAEGGGVTEKDTEQEGDT